MKGYKNRGGKVNRLLMSDLLARACRPSTIYPNNKKVNSTKIILLISIVTH